MDVTIIIQKSGFSGLRELAMNIVSNLNFRNFTVRSYERWGGILNCTLVGNRERTFTKSVGDREIVAYLVLILGVSREKAQEILENLINTGFFKSRPVTDEAGGSFLYKPGSNLLKSAEQILLTFCVSWSNVKSKLFRKEAFHASRST
jgi:hypothetical protein